MGPWGYPESSGCVGTRDLALRNWVGGEKTFFVWKEPLRGRAPMTRNRRLRATGGESKLWFLNVVRALENKVKAGKPEG